MTAKKRQPSKFNFFYSIGLFIIGTALYYSKLDSKENNIKPVQYTGMICILSSSLSIFVGVMSWICQLLFTNDKMIQANTTSNKGLMSSNSGSKYKINTLTFNNEDAIKNYSSQLTRKSWSAPAKAELKKKKSDKKNLNNFDNAVNYITVPARPSSSQN